ncbi:MAG: ATP-dependent Clp protease adaptor ClpS [Kofleriaceae bacterium]|nr:ATP-dependent Clp protease adaptor ClpS [Kofleriaceae bacterium]
MSAANQGEANEVRAVIAASAASAVLRASGLDPYALVWYLSHGQSSTARAAAGWLTRWRWRQQLKIGMHHVIMHNDDYTSRDFVVHVLQDKFALDAKSAHHAMDKVHREGFASVAVLPLLQANEQIRAAMAYAREQKFPFRLSLYPEGRPALAVARDAS